MLHRAIRIPFLAGLSLVLALWQATAGAALPLPMGEGGQPTLAPMLKKVMPAVVNISTTSRVQAPQNPLFNDPLFRRFFDAPEMPQEREAQSLGSGVIMDAAKGYVMTNNHVIDEADEILVVLRDGRRLQAKVVGKDPDADVAVIQVKADNLTALPIGDSGKLQVGDFVVAIGNPFGLGQTVTSGIVSALGRSGLGIEGYEDFIQTDASINPGNSGGALVNLSGELVGVNTAIVGPTGGNVGIGFAIPSNMAREIMDQLIRFGEVRRGQLGVFIQDLTPDLAKAFKLNLANGVVVSQVIDGSPAQKAGLQSGDVVTGMNGKPVKSASELRNAVGLLRVGSRVALDVMRSGKSLSVNAVITAPDKAAKTASAPARKSDGALSGAALGPVSPGHPLSGRIQGVEVQNLQRGSPAWAAGLRQGDIIVSVNRKPVKSPQEVQAAAKSSSGGVLLNIRRGEGALFIVVR